MNKKITFLINILILVVMGWYAYCFSVTAHEEVYLPHKLVGWVSDSLVLIAFILYFTNKYRTIRQYMSTILIAMFIAFDIVKFVGSPLQHFLYITGDITCSLLLFYISIPPFKFSAIINSYERIIKVIQANKFILTKIISMIILFIITFSISSILIN